MFSKILIIQPDQALALRLDHLLFDHGHASLRVRSAEEAKAVIEAEGRPLLIVTELSLPGMDGFEFLIWLRLRHKADDCPVVVVSAFGNLMNDASGKRYELGLNAVVSAKASALQLADIFEDALRQARQRREHYMQEAFKPPAALVAEAKSRESARLAKIASLHLDRQLPESDALKKWVSEAARAFDFPVALVSLVLEDRQWFQAQHGLTGKLLEERGTPRDWSFCRHVVEAETPSVLIVPDAKKHPSFKDNPLVKDGLVGSYVGAPIQTSDGHVLGSFCLIDLKPRQLKAEDVDLLRHLARRVAGEIELNRQVHSLKRDISDQWNLAMRREDQLAILREALMQLPMGVMLHDSNGKILLANSLLGTYTGMGPEMMGRGLGEFEAGLISLFDDPAEGFDRLKSESEGPYSAQETFETQRPERRVLRWSAHPLAVDDDWYQLSTFEDITAATEQATLREKLTLLDPLTGLLNRRGAEEEGLREAERGRRKKRPYAVAIFEIENLAAINHDQGHTQGDEALRLLAEALRFSLRLMDRPARWTGDQFLAILPETNEADACRAVERVLGALGQKAKGKALVVNVGVACADADPTFSTAVKMAMNRLRDTGERKDMVL